MRLFLLFLIVPLIEIALFVQIGGLIGLWWTLATVVVTAILGTTLVRKQGLAVLNSLQGSLRTMDNPAKPLVQGAMILFAGALLLTPGFFTDFVGFALLVPGIQLWLFNKIKGSIHIQGSHGSGFGPASDLPQTIDAEYHEVEESAPDQKPSGWTRH